MKRPQITSYSMLWAAGMGVGVTSFPLKAILVISVQYGTGYTSQSKAGGVD